MDVNVSPVSARPVTSHRAGLSVVSPYAVHASLCRFSGNNEDKPQAAKPKNESTLAKKAFISGAVISNVAIGVGGWFFPPLWAGYLVTGPLTALGVYDCLQRKHPLRYNYPLLARMRWMLESIRPEIRQYFIEDDTTGKPFSRDQRETVYKRAKLDTDTVAFGTKLDVNEVGVEYVTHSIAAKKAIKEDIRVTIGGPDCKQPYSASIFNISAMSYGALSKNAILALNRGAKMGNFYHNTGEGSISPYHFGQDVNIEEPGFDYVQFLEKMRQAPPDVAKTMGDLCWQIGTGYFGCRNPDGSFNFERYQALATLPNVKMIELKLSQGAKPGHGGILPAAKVTNGIAKIRLAVIGQDIISPESHSAFSTPIEMLQFIKKLRELSGGKPVGFKLCVGNKHEFIAVCKAMVDTGITPDFITVDGSEGGTGAAPREFADSMGMPLNDALVFVQNVLVGMNLRNRIKIIAGGKIINGYDILSKVARGADVLNSARGMMFALGCIQALECNKNTCPTGVATQNQALVNGLDPADKSVRVYNFQHQTVKNVKELLAAMGLKHTSQIKPWHVQKRVTISEIRNLSQIYEFIQPGALLEGKVPTSLVNEWNHADPKTFDSSPEGSLWKPALTAA